MKSYNAEISFLSNEDKQKILDLLVLENKVWNSCSEMVFENKPILGLKTVHKLCYYKLKEAFPTSPSQLIIRVEKDVVSTFQSIKSNKHNISVAPIKKNLSVRLDKRLYALRKNGDIGLTTLEKRIEIKLKLYPKIKEMFSKYNSLDPLMFERDDKLFLSIPFETPNNTIIVEPIAVGIDLGIKNLATTSEGIIYKDGKYLARKKEIRFLKRILQHKGTKSARRHLKKLRRKESNRTKNMVHHLANAILNDSKGNVIVLEDLSKIKQNTKRGKKFNNKHSQIPYYMIRQYLEYKAPSFGKKVETVNPRFTSQIDSRTGLKDGVREKGRYIGKDGKVLHADYNASINIAIRSKLPISQGSNSMIFGKGLVNVPIVNKSKSSIHTMALPHKLT